jgi:hypothetical protein
MNVDEVLASLSEGAFKALLEDAPPKGGWELQPLEWTRFLPSPLGEELLRHNLVTMLYTVLQPSNGVSYRCQLTPRGQAVCKAARELHTAQGALKGPAT